MSLPKNACFGGGHYLTQVNSLSSTLCSGPNVISENLFQSNFLVAPLMILTERALYVDYLPPLGPYVCGIYIPSVEATENYDLDTFVAPFKANLWFLVLALILIISCTKLILLKINNCYQTFDGIWCLWSSFTAIFGGATHQNDLLLKTKISYRSTIFTSLFSGTLIWMAYRSCMTAEFNDFLKKYPFTDMETFSRTDWR